MRIFLGIVISLLLSGFAQAATVVATFEENYGLPPLESYNPISNGFAFTGDIVQPQTRTNGLDGSYNGVVSGDVVLLFSDVMTISATEASGYGEFDFIGAYLTAWPEQGEVTIAGYRDNEQVYESSLELANTASPTWYEFNFTAVDYLIITGSAQMDDFTANVVPIPAAVWLFLSGLVVLARFRPLTT